MLNKLRVSMEKFQYVSWITMNLTGWVSVCVVLLFPTVFSRVVTFIVDVSENNEEYIYQFQESIRTIVPKLKSLKGNEYRLITFEKESYSSSEVLDVDGLANEVKQMKVSNNSPQNCSGRVFSALRDSLSTLNENIFAPVIFVITSSYANDYNTTINEEFLENIQERNPQINFIIGRFCNMKMADIYRDTAINTYGQMYYVDQNPSDLKNVILNMFLKLELRAQPAFYEPFYGNGTYKIEIPPHMVAAQIEITSATQLILTRVVDKENAIITPTTFETYNYHQYIIKTDKLINIEIEVRSTGITIIEVLFVPDFNLDYFFCDPKYCEDTYTLRPKKETSVFNVYVDADIYDYNVDKIEIFPQLSSFYFPGKSIRSVTNTNKELFQFYDFNVDGMSNFAIRIFLTNKNTKSRIAIYTRVQHKILNFVLD